jgi:hypothetical protein
MGALDIRSDRRLGKKEQSASCRRVSCHWSCYLKSRKKYFGGGNGRKIWHWQSSRQIKSVEKAGRICFSTVFLM